MLRLELLLLLLLPTGFTNSHCYPSFPPTSPLSYCHLHLHSGPFQWWEAFYLYSEARCRHGEGCSSLEDNGLVRLYASETPHLRPAQLRSLLPRPHARSEASELAAYQSTTARFSAGAFVSARMGPAWHKRRSRYNERAQPQTRLLICQHDVTSW